MQTSYIKRCRNIGIKIGCKKDPAAPIESFWRLTFVNIGVFAIQDGRRGYKGCGLPHIKTIRRIRETKWSLDLMFWHCLECSLYLYELIYLSFICFDVFCCYPRDSLMSFVFFICCHVLCVMVSRFLWVMLLTFFILSCFFDFLSCHVLLSFMSLIVFPGSSKCNTGLQISLMLVHWFSFCFDGAWWWLTFSMFVKCCLLLAYVL